MLPYWFYLAGSLCFAIGTTIVLAAHYVGSQGGSMYKIKVYVAHGYFQYSINEMSSALEHAQIIAERGVYRRSRKRCLG